MPTCIELIQPFEEQKQRWDFPRHVTCIRFYDIIIIPVFTIFLFLESLITHQDNQNQILQNIIDVQVVWNSYKNTGSKKGIE